MRSPSITGGVAVRSGVSGSAAPAAGGHATSSAAAIAPRATYDIRESSNQPLRSAAYEEELRKAKDIATEEMIQQAQSLGGNAIIAVDIDYETISPAGGSMLMVAVSGTAIIIE